MDEPSTASHKIHRSNIDLGRSAHTERFRFNQSSLKRNVLDALNGHIVRRNERTIDKCPHKTNGMKEPSREINYRFMLLLLCWQAKTVNNKRRKVGIRARIPVLYKELSCFSLVDIFDLRYYLMLVPGVDGWGTGEEEIFNNNHQDMMPRFCLVRRRIINLRNIWMVNRISSIRDSARINCLLLIFL